MLEERQFLETFKKFIESQRKDEEKSDKKILLEVELSTGTIYTCPIDEVTVGTDILKMGGGCIDIHEVVVYLLRSNPNPDGSSHMGFVRHS